MAPAQILDGGTTAALAGLTANTAGGSLTLKDGAALASPGAFSNSGSLTVGAGSRFTVKNNGNYTSAGASIIDGTLTAGTATLTGSLTGAGVIAANLVNDGAVTPGDSPGILTISGNYQQGSGGVLNIEVGGTTAGTQYDQLKVSGTATLAGTLDATLINGFGPGAGEQFAALTAGGGISGSFATINLPSIDGQPAFTVQTIAGPPPSVELFAAVEAPDLAAVGGSITVNGVSPASAAGTTGQSLTVGYTIANLSSDAATGTWTDSVYLSANGLAGRRLPAPGTGEPRGGTGRDVQLQGDAHRRGAGRGRWRLFRDRGCRQRLAGAGPQSREQRRRLDRRGPGPHPAAGARRHRERDDRGRAGPLLQSDGAAGPGCRDRRRTHRRE